MSPENSPHHIDYLSPPEAIEQGESPQHRFDLVIDGQKRGAAEINYFSKPLPIYQLTDLYVDAELKGQGYASHLMDQVENFLRQRHRPGILVDAIIEGDPAAGMYERRGWQEDPSMRGRYVYNWPEDVSLDVLRGYESRYTDFLIRENRNE